MQMEDAWKKFREYLPILTGKGFSLKPGLADLNHGDLNH